MRSLQRSVDWHGEYLVIELKCHGFGKITIEKTNYIS
jgi:hypothetical protein